MTEEIATAQETLASTEIVLNQAGENREAENAQYQVPSTELATEALERGGGACPARGRGRRGPLCRGSSFGCRTLGAWSSDVGGPSWRLRSWCWRMGTPREVRRGMRLAGRSRASGSEHVLTHVT